MGSWVALVMGFLPANFELAMPFYYRLRIERDRRQTDGRTDNGHRWIMPHAPYVGGHNKYVLNLTEHVVIWIIYKLDSQTILCMLDCLQNANAVVEI